MENTNDEIAEKTLPQWMADEDMSDLSLAGALEVRRETVWRWRVKGFKPHRRERKRIIEIAGCNIIFGGRDGAK